ncbi:hypothetical protein CDAR_247471 [Caerostris darwini]|uniref:Uncharacterized protein n=1 Tax=Caerostris darwini TaxID=1538125 RepID=A0AAV4R7X4_9ARAC|nr:hypothetical protein CDAR_247471 [Caerostris darwini]
MSLIFKTQKNYAQKSALHHPPTIKGLLDSYRQMWQTEFPNTTSTKQQKKKKMQSSKNHEVLTRTEDNEGRRSQTALHEAEGWDVLFWNQP